jgi:hypothetical protein
MPLVQRIKDTYSDMEKGKSRLQGILHTEWHVVHLAFQLIAGKIVWKNKPTQVTGFVVDLAEKCMEGLQMNWVSYLVNQLEQDCHKDQDQGYEFHFS